MICSLDFGRYRTRAMSLNEDRPEVVWSSECASTYMVLPNSEVVRCALREQGLPMLNCDQSILVAGADQERVRELSSLPPVPLFTNGRVPREDAPARQMLHLLVQSLLPDPAGSGDLCVITVPELSHSDTTEDAEFLERLVRMRGYESRVLGAAEALMLSGTRQYQFSGVSVVMGAEASSICIAHRGLVFSKKILSECGNLLDRQLAEEFRMNTWDTAGVPYTDFEQIRHWRQHLSESSGITGDRRVARLVELFGESVSRLAEAVLQAVGGADAGLDTTGQIPVVLAGGVAKTPGMAQQLELELHQQCNRRFRFCVEVTDQPDQAIVRGALVYGLLDSESGPTDAVRAA